MRGLRLGASRSLWEPLRRVWESLGSLWERDGCPTAGSVTALVHWHSRPFCEDAVIDAMQRSANWPRAGYLVSHVSLELLEEVLQWDGATALCAPLCQTPLKEPVVLEETCNFLRLQPQRRQQLPACLALSRQQIKQKWRACRTIEGASRGTWTHAHIECLLNAGAVSAATPEVILK